MAMMKRFSLRRFLLAFVRGDAGNIAVFTALIITTLIAAGGVAIDYSRSSGLHQKLQQGVDTAVREAARGKSDAEVQSLVHGQVDAYMRSMGYDDPGGSLRLTLNRGTDGVATLNAQVDYTPLFGPLYTMASGALDVGASATARSFCSAPTPETQWVASSEDCPAGQDGTVTFEAEQQRVASCATPTSTPTWGAWSATGGRRNEVNSCFTPCVVPAAESQWVDRSTACPAGYLGSHTWQAEQQRTGYCPSAGGSPAWNAWTDTGSTRDEADTCAAACVAEAPETRWSASVAVSCDAGFIGSRYVEYEQQRTSYCPSATGAPAWNAWANTGNTREVSNSCTPEPPPCVVPPAETQWVDRSGSCQAGYLGDHTWQAEQRRTAYCPTSTGDPAWNSWTDTGSTRNDVNTCAAACVAPAAETRWSDKTGACPSGQTGTQYWQAEERRTAYCPAATGAYSWSSWTATGATRNASNNCVAAPGEAVWTVPGVYQWPVPVGITQIGAVAVGGGAAGQTTISNVGFQDPGGNSSVAGGSFTLVAKGAKNYAGGCGGEKQGGGCGGDGGFNFFSLGIQSSGGGGAGGYGGDGGHGGMVRPSTMKDNKVNELYFPRPGNGGAGGGGDASTYPALPNLSVCSMLAPTLCQSRGGGGVGLAGWGNDGGAGGGGGSGGGDGQWSQYSAGNLNGPRAIGGMFGGGGGTGPGGLISGGGGELSWANFAVTPGQILTITVGDGGSAITIAGRPGVGDGMNGAVRIIWGPGRSYPYNAN